MARDPRISGIFYYFEQHTNIASGRTVGRKIGVVQEILCKKLLQQSLRIRDSIIYEPKLPGLSGATHKVEFVLLQPASAVNLTVGKTWSVVPGLSITALRADSTKRTARIAVKGTKEAKLSIKAGLSVKLSAFIPGSTLLVKLVKVTAGLIRLSLLDMSRPVASIESKRVGAQRFSSSNKLGSGIQTIEKAKQASLVAVDFDLRFNGTLLSQTGPRMTRAFKSIVVLGNGVHWTVHDLAILSAYVDYTFLATDAAIIRYADFVRDLAKKQKADFFKFFMAYFKGMTKTPDDAFTVSPSDFVAMRPKNSGSLIATVEGQIQKYPVSTI